MARGLGPGRRYALFKQLWDLTDQKLVALCQKGRPQAWEAFVKRYKNLVYHFPNSAGLPSEDCDEVFQETFLALYRGLDKLSEVQEMSHWIATIAQRNTWKLIHRNRRRPEDDLPEGYEFESPDDIPSDDLEVKVQQAKIRQALNMLNGRCRELLKLLFYKYDSSDYTEIAKELGIARGSIGPIRHRCLVKLKSKLESLGINEKSVSKWFD